MRYFLKNRKLYRNTVPLKQSSGEPVLRIDEGLQEVESVDDATLVSSVSMVMGGEAWHLPVLDLDYEAHLEPSSTPGHYHLYLDRHVEHDKYMRLLEALADCGLIEWGYYDAGKKRGATFVRVPGVRKGVDLPASERP
jgi:hypothetical protein